MAKAAEGQPLKGAEWNWCSFNAPSPRIAIIALSGSPVKNLILKTIFICPNLELPQCEQPFPREFVLKK